MDKQFKQTLLVELGKMLTECEVCETKVCDTCPLYADMRTIGMFLWREKTVKNEKGEKKVTKDKKDWAVIDQYIIDHYDKEPIKTIALNTGCCVRTISIRSKKLRQQGLLKKEQVNKRRQFSEDELKFIMSHAGKLSTREIAQRIGRSPEMVRRKIRELRGGTHGSMYPQNAS